MICRLIGDVRHVAVGAASPIPATAALLRARKLAAVGRPYVSLLGSRAHTFFTDGARELFDCAGQGRIDVFFLSGGQIDGAGNINLVSVGDYAHPKARFPGSFGSAYLYYVVPKVILFRVEHSRRTLVPKVDFISAPGGSADNVFRPGGPIALVTNRCLFDFDREQRRFRLASVHPGHSVAEVVENTGFEFDRPDDVPVTPAPSAETLNLMRAPSGRCWPRSIRSLPKTCSGPRPWCRDERAKGAPPRSRVMVARLEQNVYTPLMNHARELAINAGLALVERARLRKSEAVACTEPTYVSTASSQRLASVFSMNRLNVLDLFSGAGGMSCGFHAHPFFQVVGAVDAENGKPSSGNGSLECNKTYVANIGVTPLQADLSQATPEQIEEYLVQVSKTRQVDVLISCAPCTGFSRTIRKCLVEDDHRNALVSRTGIFVEYFRPKILVMENVGELLEGKFTSHFSALASQLKRLGYSISAHVHDLTRFGLPQRRRRSCVIAVAKGLHPLGLDDLWTGFRIRSRAITVRHAIERLPPLSAGHVDPSDPWHVSPKISHHGVERLKRLPKNGGSWPDLLKVSDGEEYLIPSMKAYSDQGRVGPYRDVYGRLSWDQPAVTIKRECSHIGNGRYSHPEQDRLCTVRELAILQGFPRGYIFVAGSLSNMYRHIGDAVPPLIAFQISHLCKWILTGERPSQEEVLLAGTHLEPGDLVRDESRSIQLKMAVA